MLLCRAGAEVLYADLGHAGRGNIYFLLDFRQDLPYYPLPQPGHHRCLAGAYFGLVHASYGGALDVPEQESFGFDNSTVLIENVPRPEPELVRE